MTTPGVSSWPYKEGKASREDTVERYQTPKGHGREVHVAPLDHDEVAHYPGDTLVAKGLIWSGKKNLGQVSDFLFSAIIVNNIKPYVP